MACWWQAFPGCGDRLALEDVVYERRSRKTGCSWAGGDAYGRRHHGKPVPLARLSVQDTIPLEVDVLDADTSASSSPNAQTLRT